jgi:hypothetical protein
MSKTKTDKATEQSLYITTDLYLSAYLIVKGHEMEFEKKTKKTYFKFIRTDNLDVNANEYLKGSGTTPPLAYANAIKNLKNLLFNQ